MTFELLDLSLGSHLPVGWSNALLDTAMAVMRLQVLVACERNLAKGLALSGVLHVRLRSQLLGQDLLSQIP